MCLFPKTISRVLTMLYWNIPVLIHFKLISINNKSLKQFVSIYKIYIPMTICLLRRYRMKASYIVNLYIYYRVKVSKHGKYLLTNTSKFFKQKNLFI